MTHASPLERILCCEECQEQIVAAKRELGAFMEAIGMLFGETEAARAADCWLELVESDEMPFADGDPSWRQITIAAASRLARGRFLTRKPERSEEEKQ